MRQFNFVDDGSLDRSTPKHTPGPWKISNTGSPITHHWKIKNFDGLHIAEVNIGMSDFKANAELIARAPELLEQIKQLEAERSELVKENERLKNWLWQYREEMKSTNVFHANQGIINQLNKLLP